MIKQIKTFNGKKYTRRDSSVTERGATTIANKFRRFNQPARVIRDAKKDGGRWAIYVNYN